MLLMNTPEDSFRPSEEEIKRKYEQYLALARDRDDAVEMVAAVLSVDKRIVWKAIGYG
jgi:hypothetical protein